MFSVHTPLPVRLAKSIEHSSLTKAPCPAGDGSIGGSQPEGFSQSYQFGENPDKLKPEFPAISPSVSLLSPLDANPLGSKNNFFDFQVRRDFNEAGSVSRILVHRGKILIAGKYIPSISSLHPSSIDTDWFPMPPEFQTGQIWLKSTFNYQGQLTATEFTTTGAISTPIPLSISPASDSSTIYTYYTHIATITSDDIFQHQVGSIHLLLAAGTFGPPGMA